MQTVCLLTVHTVPTALPAIVNCIEDTFKKWRTCGGESIYKLKIMEISSK